MAKRGAQKELRGPLADFENDDGKNIGRVAGGF
jgi:hypothetical protein